MNRWCRVELEFAPASDCCGAAGDALVRTPTVLAVAGCQGDWHGGFVVKYARRAAEDLRAVWLEVACDEAWSLTTDRRLTAVGGEVTPPTPVGAFVVLRRQSELWRLTFPWAANIRLWRRSSGLEIRCRVQDRSACGLRDWGDEKLAGEVLHDGGEAISLELACDRLAGLEDCVWVEPYPGACPAAVCITDHPDFDTVEKACHVFEPLAQAGIRLTKAVFPSSEPRGEKQEPGLDIPDYLAFVRRLYAAGSEIAFHGLGPRVDAPPIDECRRRADMLVPFCPETWIDHGTGEYLFVRRAELPGRIPLREFLRPYGICNYWSYFDIWDNPFRDLSCLHARKGWDAISDMVRGMRHILRGPRCAYSLQSGLYLLRHAAQNLASARSIALLRARRLDSTSRRTLREARRRHRNISAAPLLVYALDGTNARAAIASEWAFDTVVLNHPALQLRSPLLERLARASGLVIAHTYLCATHPYLAGGAFTSRGVAAGTAPGFAEAVRELERAQSSRQIVTLPMRELRLCLTRFARVRTVRNERGWHVEGLGADEKAWIGGTALAAGDSVSHPCGGDVRARAVAAGEQWIARKGDPSRFASIGSLGGG